MRFFLKLEFLRPFLVWLQISIHLAGCLDWKTKLSTSF